MQTADRIQNVDSRLQSGYKMQTENLKSFFVWYVITCHPTTYRASRNRFSAISFHDYLHFCGIFLAHFFPKIDRNVISSLHIVFLLCARVGLCDVCVYFVDKNEDRDQNCSFNLINFRRSQILTYLLKSFIPDNKIK